MDSRNGCATTGRSTRSGAEFSLWLLSDTQPGVIVTDIDIQEAAVAEIERGEDAGYASEDALDLDYGDIDSGTQGLSSSSSTANSPVGFAVPPLDDLSDLTELSDDPEAAPTTILGKRKRKKAYKKALRNRKRRKKQEEQGTCVKGVTQRRVAAANAFETKFDVSSLPRATTSWIGLRDSGIRTSAGVEELMQKGFELFPWDGRSSHYIVDRNGFTFGILGGALGEHVPAAKDDGQDDPAQPSSSASIPPSLPQSASADVDETPKQTWAEAIASAADAIEHARQRASFTAAQRDHRRGSFPALAVGASFGGGQRRPGMLCNSRENAAATKMVTSNQGVRRVAGYQSCLLHGYCPRLGEHYRDTLNSIIRAHPGIQRNFENSDFAALTTNFGPSTVCLPHTDSANLAWGLCAITALGSFDPDTGGHLILWNLRLIIRFPPGSTILIPSALIRHSNTPISASERRYSLTQYSAGGLFRWVYNGFRPEAAASSSDNADSAARDARERDRRDRWKKGINMLRRK
ncbi:hypothetical protein HGRIS_014829 [Hohenbuehelia grisea]|uniref:Uncharacterized protein n=1 Tax=Hohenbuehelia grisea TaxID=104357 RepID=A0ABR3IQX2_9AGAR